MLFVCFISKNEQFQVPEKAHCSSHCVCNFPKSHHLEFEVNQT